MIGSGLVEPAVRAVGLEGVSAGVLAVLVAVALYAHKAASVGGRAVRVGSTVQHDLKVIAVVLAALLVLGVISADPHRAQELIQLGERRLARFDLLERLWRAVP